MSTGMYVTLSGEMALEKRLDTIANNLANMNTDGFRADGIKFESILASAGDDDVAFASSGEDYISRNPGPVSYTGNNLDVAVDGDAWLALQSPDGTIYTRDGRMHLSDLGELQSVRGYPVLDAGGSAISLDASAGPAEISGDGAITQGGKRVGTIGLFVLPDTAKLTRYDNSGVVPDKPAAPAEDLTTNGVRQGYVEGSNVNPILEMTKLIEVSRAFDNAVAAMEQSDSNTDEAIKTLGPS